MGPEFADHIEPDPQQTAPGKARRKRLGEVESQAQASEPESKSRRKVLGEIEPQVHALEPTIASEALVDIATAPKAGELPAPSKSGRPRLVNTEPMPEEPQPQPQPKPGRPRLADGETLPREEEPPFVMQPPSLMDLETQVPVQQPGLVDLDAQIDIEPPSKKHQPHPSDEMATAARPKTGEQQTRQAPPAHSRPATMETVPDAQERQSNPACPPPTNAHSRGGLQEPQSPAPRLHLAAKAPRCAEPRTSAAVKPSLEQTMFMELLAELRAKQNLARAAIGSLLVAIGGALLWALISLVSGAAISSMAIGVGFLVGSTVHMFGQGIDRSFGRLGAAMSAFGCVLGAYLATWMLVAREAGVSLTAVLSHLGFAGIAGATLGGAHPLDIIFYGIAIYEGYIFSFRRLTDTAFDRVVQQDGRTA